VPHSQVEIIEREIHELLKQNVIEPSVSAWSSPLLLVKKKTGEYRVVLDLRRVNQQIEIERFPIPNIQQILSTLHGSKIFSLCDLAQGYQQIELEENSREYTTFQVPTLGSYRYTRCPFGVNNSPSVFTKCLAIALSGVIGNAASIYLDDILIATENMEQHFDKLDQILGKLEDANLKIKLSKCNFLQPQVLYLGCVLTKEGIKADPEKLRTLREYPIPKNVKEVQSYVGFIGFYRAWISDFSSIAKPLFNLSKKDTRFAWTEEHQSAFERLRDSLLEGLTIMYPDFTRPFIIATDASAFGVGAVLAQEDERGREKPISFASRLLTPTEAKYSTIEREALAVIWSLEKFRHLVFGYKIIIFTDHSPLVSILGEKYLEGRLGKIALRVSQYSVTVKYRAGKLNVIPDHLSRMNKDKFDENAQRERSIRMATIPKKLTEEDMITAQAQDEYLKNIAKIMYTNKTRTLGQYGMTLEGMIFHKDEFTGERTTEVPESLLETVIKEDHATIIKRETSAFPTRMRIRKKFHFPDLQEKVERICKKLSENNTEKESIKKPYNVWEHAPACILMPRNPSTQIQPARRPISCSSRPSHPSPQTPEATDTSTPKVWSAEKDWQNFLTYIDDFPSAETTRSNTPDFDSYFGELDKSPGYTQTQYENFLKDPNYVLPELPLTSTPIDFINRTPLKTVDEVFPSPIFKSKLKEFYFRPPQFALVREEKERREKEKEDEEMIEQIMSSPHRSTGARKKEKVTDPSFRLQLHEEVEPSTMSLRPRDNKMTYPP
jgi:hypothetical protein